MISTSKIRKLPVLFILPILIILLLVILSRSDLFLKDPNALSIGITVDLLISVPLIYFLLIRKTNIPKISTGAFFIVGLLIASAILPKENQALLKLAKTWILPLVELAILGFLFHKMRQINLKFKALKSVRFDFFNALKSASLEILPRPVAIVFTTEIAAFYYGFLNWKKIDPKPHEFTYHRETGIQSILIAILFLIAIETPIIHLLIMKWSVTAAWIVTGVSVYSGIQVLGILKSLSRRFISIEKDRIYLRYGIFNEAVIDIENISHIRYSPANTEDELTDVKKLSPFYEFDGHNVILCLNRTVQMDGFYGLRSSFTKLAFHIDDLEKFKDLISKSLTKQSIKFSP